MAHNPLEPERCAACGAAPGRGSSDCPRCGLTDTQVRSEPRRQDGAPAAASALQPDSRYEVLEPIGRGASGVVLKVRDRELDEVIALKVLDPERPEADSVRQFKQELKLARRINHPCVARLHDLVLWRGRLAITQELIEGRRLTELLDEGPLPVESLAPLTRWLCSALDAAHAVGVVHRDLKPGNILIDDQGRPHILDFGIASLVGAVQEDSSISGTPSYMAPEQAFDPLKVDQRTDIYSLGIVLFQAATGRVPFKGSLLDVITAHERERPPRPRSLREELPRSIDQVILRCLEKRPEDRYASALAVYEELERLSAREARSLAGPARIRPGVRVLIVDDDDELRRWMVEVVAALGPETSEAGDGADAVEKALELEPDLILLDVLMPRLDGRASLRMLKRNPATADIPIVMITGLSDEEEALSSKAAGAAAFINKPIQRDVLELVIERYLHA